MKPLSAPILGMTIMPEYVQVEGVQQVLDRAGGLAGATAICTAPALMEPADAATGAREPPSDAGAGGVRTLDRPLWGQHALFVRSAPSFAPNPALYADGPYAPPPAQELTRREGKRIAEFLVACRRSGIETQFQVMAAAPPAIRVQFRQTRADDEPLTVFGKPVPGRVDANLSLASPALRIYMRALIADIVANYPELDAFRFDWPEYPPYAPESLLFDFSPTAVAFGRRSGFDVEEIRQRCLELFQNGVDLPALLRTFGPTGISEATLAHLGLTEFFDYRAALVRDYAGFLVETVAEASGGRMKVYLQGFPPPLNRLSGFDLAGLDALGADLGVKLFTMHWPMIERAYAEKLTALTDVDPVAAFTLVRRALGFTADAVTTPDQVRYPEPHETHPADTAAIIGKLETARAPLRKSAFWAIAHGYGPVDDVMRRLSAAFTGAGGRVHMNRYGYLDDDKLARIGALMRSLKSSDDRSMRVNAR